METVTSFDSDTKVIQVVTDQNIIFENLKDENRLNFEKENLFGKNISCDYHPKLPDSQCVYVV